MPKKYREVRRRLRAAGASQRVARDVAQPGRVAPRDDCRQGFGHGPTRYACRYASRYGIGRPAMREYLVIYERGDEGDWGAHSPDVEGVFALGTSRDEV